MKDKDEIKRIDSIIESKIRVIVDKLKASHEKFEDPDFGPREKDESGAISFYGDGPPDPAGSKYPAPSTLKWERPRYRDENGSAGDEQADAEAVAGEADQAVAEGANVDEDDEFAAGGDDDEDSEVVSCRLNRYDNYLLLWGLLDHMLAALVQPRRAVRRRWFLWRCDSGQFFAS